MRVRFLAVWMLLAAAAPGGAAAAGRTLVRRVQVVGTHRVAAAQVQGWLATRPGVVLDSLTLEQDVRRILDGYRDAGFWQAAVLAPQVKVVRGGASVRFRVEEGRPTRIDSVEISGNRSLSRKLLLGAMRSRKGSLLLRRNLEADLDALLRLYEDRGYPFCALRPHVDLAPGRNGAGVQVAVDEGPFVRIDTVRFTGNRITRAEVLRRETGLHPGEPYDQRRVDRALQALRRLPFLLGVGGASLKREPDGRMALVVRVREARGGRVEGALGYAPGQGSVSGGLTGSFSLDFDNLMGTGRGGHLKWARQGPAASDLELGYLEPRALGGPVSVQVQGMMRQRPQYAENRVGLAFGISPGQGTEFHLGFRRSGTQPDSSGFGQIEKSRVWAVEGDGQYDRRDNRWNPRSGLLYQARFSLGRVFRNGGSAVRQEEAVDLAWFFPLGTQSVLATAVHGAMVAESGGVPPDARLPLGGSATIRGYREEAFLATRAVWANLEWRQVLGLRSRAFVFCDLGALDEPDAGGRTLARFPLGYGAGVRLESRSGVIELDYGLAAGDSPGQGKVHLRMINAF